MALPDFPSKFSPDKDINVTGAWDFLGGLEVDGLDVATTSSSVEFMDGSIQAQAVSNTNFTHHIDTLRLVNDFDTGLSLQEGISFDNSGYMMIVSTNNTLTQAYTLSTKHDPTTGTLDLGTLALSSNWAFYVPDGSRVIIGAAQLTQYDLPTPFDLSTATNLVQQSVTVGRDAFIRPDGKQIIVGSGGSTTHTLDLESAFDISGSIVQSGNITIDSLTQIFGINFKSNGSIVMLVDASARILYEYDLKIPYDMTTRVAVRTVDMDADTTLFPLTGQIRGYRITGDGSKTILNNSSDAYYAYDMGIDVPGILTERGNRLRPLASNTVAMFIPADRPNLNGGDPSTATAQPFGQNLIMMAPLTAASWRLSDGTSLRLDNDNRSFNTYSYNDTLNYIRVSGVFGQTGSVSIDVRNHIVFPITGFTSGRKFLECYGADASIAPLGITLCQHLDSACLGFENLGIIQHFQIMLFRLSSYRSHSQTGFDIIDVASVLFEDTEFIPAGGGTGSQIKISGNLVDASIRSNAFILGASESCIRIDPAVPDDAIIIVGGSKVSGSTNLFDVSGTAPKSNPGTFSAAADASVSTITIDSVTSGNQTSGGNFATFNFTGVTVYGRQTITISGFTGDFTPYNITAKVNGTGSSSTFFTLEDVLFITSGTGSLGVFDTVSISITTDNHVLANGVGITVSSDDGTHYDGGAYAYNVVVGTPGSCQIDRAFDGAAATTGTWTNTGLDQKDPRILATANPGFIDSKYIVCGSVSDNVTDTAITSIDTWTPLILGVVSDALVDSEATERWKLIDELSGTYEYVGNEPFDGSLSFTIEFTKSGGTAVEYEFRYAKDTGGGFSPLPDQIVLSGTVSSSVTLSQTVTIPLTADKGDQIRPEVLGVGSSADPLISDFVCYGTG